MRVGCLSPAVAQEREVEGDLFLHDMGEGLGFRAGTFDGVISVSALQWLCNADRKTQHPPKRLHCFFSSLYACMVSSPLATRLELATWTSTRNVEILSLYR